MNFELFGKSWLVAFRNGFGFDIESTDSRPILVQEPEAEHLILAAFNGLIFSFPFLVVMIGEAYEI